MKISRTLGVLIAIVLSVTLAAAAVAGGGLKRFAHGSDRGTNAVATASGQTKEPRKIIAEVTSSPSDLRIGAKYATICAKGTKSGSRGDVFTGHTPIRKKLRLRFRDPDVCQASLTAKMKGTGTIEVVLFKKRQG